jgi:hypothetical protein
MRLNLRETMSTLVTSQIDHMQVNNFIVLTIQQHYGLNEETNTRRPRGTLKLP